MTAIAPDTRTLREDRTLYRAAQILQRRWSTTADSDVFDCSSVAKDYFRQFLAGRDREHFVVALLNPQHRLLAVETLHTGTLSRCEISIREVARRALAHNAAVVVVAHNHPGGSPAPSEADIRVTQELFAALATLEIELLDHIVVATGGATSLSELGHLRWYPKHPMPEGDRPRLAAARKAAETRKRNREAARAQA